MKLRGLEKFWMNYVELMAALTNGGELKGPLRAISQGFTARNKDKRLTGDDLRTEGTGYGPVNWDFRAASLARYAQDKYGQDLVSMVSWPFAWEPQAEQ